MRLAGLLAVSFAVVSLMVADAQTVHPRDEYRNRPPGTPVLSIERTDSPLSEEQRRILDQLTGAQPVARIGADEAPPPEIFGKIRDVALDADTRIYVLDESFVEIRVFSPDGSFIQSVGGPGQGPGEFQIPSALAIDSRRRLLYVGDTAYRLDVFNLPELGDDGPIEYDRSIRVGVKVRDVALLGESIVIHGMKLATQGRLQDPQNIKARILHIITSEGNPVRSFGTVYESPNMIVNHQVFKGSLACGQGMAEIFLAPKMLLGEVRSYGLDGRNRWIAVMSDFRPVYLADSRGLRGSRMQVPSGGFSEVEGLIAIDEGHLLVQQSQYVSEGDGPYIESLHSHLISTESGRSVYVGSSLPLIVATNQSHFISLKREPFPILTVWQMTGASAGER